MSFKHDAPGLKTRRNKDGTTRLYWVARTDLVKAGYEPETIRLPYRLDEADHHLLISAACMKYQAEMLAWAAGHRDDNKRFDGTIASLVRLYQVDEASSYRGLKWNTKRTYDDVLKTIERAFGKRVLSALKIGDFRLWYAEAKKPAIPGGPERVRKAHGIISMLRRLFAYGVTAELKECARLAAILDEARFKQPGRRKVKLELAHVEAFVEKAIEMSRVSLALGTALQFETTLRQKDVIGEWEPIPEGEAETGIVLNRRRWVNGLTWADVTTSFEVRKSTTRNGADVAHDLTLCPIVLRVLAHVPVDKRVGPMIVNEVECRPYAEFTYAHEWRVVARAAGIPDHIQNMDARAGGISEADDAGADLDDIRAHAGHTLPSTTARYGRATSKKSRKVAELRLAHRATKNKD